MSEPSASASPPSSGAGELQDAPPAQSSGSFVSPTEAPVPSVAHTPLPMAMPPTSQFPSAPPAQPTPSYGQPSAGPSSDYAQQPAYGAAAPGPQGTAYPQGAYNQGAYNQGPAYTPYQSYGYPYPAMPGMQQDLPKGMAITGMVLGIVGVILSLAMIGGVLGIIGLVFSIVALRAASAGRAAGKGMAIAGLVTSIVSILVTAAWLTFLIAIGTSVNNCDQSNPAVNPNATYGQLHDCLNNNGIGT
ncbi:MAG: DUF4190 domain-containing protein [Actinocrinis sp.]